LKLLSDWTRSGVEQKLRALWIYAVLPGSVLITVFLAAWRGYVIEANAVDVPQAWDEWNWLWGLNRSLNWQWVWAQHNEYRLVLTKLLTWLLYRFDGWNQFTALRVSYALFFVIPALILVMAWRDSRSSMWALVPFLMFFFSNASVESDVTGAMSLVKFLLGFCCWGCCSCSTRSSAGPLSWRDRSALP